MSGWVVTCEDGEVRHDEPFATYREADKWAHWGHACTTRHTYQFKEGKK